LWIAHGDISAGNPGRKAMPAKAVQLNFSAFCQALL
jgi:hypothetical protein